MRAFALSLAASALLAGSTYTFADSIPYPNAGTVAPATVLTATGSSVVFYYGYNASDTDEIDLIDITNGTSTGWTFTNNATAPGQSLTLPAAKGDTIVVGIENVSTSSYFYSETGSGPAGYVASSDGLNHAYVTTYSGGNIPGTSVDPGFGAFVGMEDLDVAQNTDWDYNDDQFVLTGVTFPGMTPEPGSIALLGTGMLGLAGVIRRKLSC